MQSFEQRLDRLAEVAVKVGVRIRPGQELVMTAPVEALPLARRITEHAYKAGASLVTTLFSDDAMTLLRFQNAPDESFDKASGWLFDGMAAAFRSGAARLAIVGEDPSLLVGAGYTKGGAGQPRALGGLSSRAGIHRQFRRQLEHRLVRDAGLGQGRLP